MARTRRTPEAQVMSYFRTAPAESAKLLFGIVSDLMKERFPAAAKKPKPTRAPKPAPAPPIATE